MKIRLRYNFIITFFLLSFVSFAQSSILEITTEKEVYTLGKYVSVYEDTSAMVTFDQIRSNRFQNKFKRSELTALNYGVTPSVIWIKIQLKNLESNPNIQWLISLDYPLFDYVDFYQKNPLGEWSILKTGDKFPFSERQIPDRNFVFATHFPFDTLSTYYLRFETSGSMQITPSLYRERAYLVSNNNAEIAYGLFFGGMMIIMLYNLFLFFSLKDYAYLAYCIFIVASFSLQAAYSGHFIKYWYGNDPYWANLMIPLIMVINPITMAIFSIIFLKTKKFAPLWHKILVGIIVIGCIHFVSSFYLPAIKAIPLAGLITTITLFSVFFAGIAAYRRGNKSARFYLVAWFVLIIVALLAAFRLFGIVPSNNLTVHGVKLAILSEVVLLALALADKYNIFRKEKEDAQQKILQMQEEANKVLEEKVEQRTVELAEANHKLSDTLSKVEEERGKSDKLLLNILPAETAAELKEKGFSAPKKYELATVMFTDFKNFTHLVEELPPEVIIEVLDTCFLTFDEICDRNNIEKIKTIGDSYMAAGGLPVANPNNPIDAVRAALEIQKWMYNWDQSKYATQKQKWEIRIGVHSGPVMAGVVGKNKFAYDIWGDTVNIASRMESCSEVGQVSISKATFELVKDHFDCEYKGKVAAKNIGEVDVFWVKQ